MMKLIFHFLWISIFSVIIACSDKKDTKSIEIQRIDWSYAVRRRFDIRDVSIEKRGYSQVIIKSQNEINEIKARLESLDYLPDFRDVDVRMYCVFNYSVGDTDTLKVGSPHIYKFQNKVYDKDSILLNLLENAFQSK